MKIGALVAAAVLLPAGTYAADIARPPAPVQTVPVVATPLGGLIVEGWIGGAFVATAVGNVDPDHTSLFNYSETGRWAFALGGTHTIQLDLGAETTNNRQGVDNFDLSWLWGVHLDTRDANGLRGVFGGMSTSYNEDTIQSWFVGAEHQTYRGNTTYQLQGGYFTSDDHALSIYNVGFVRFLGRHFLSPTQSWQAEVTAGVGQQDSDAQPQYLLEWGARWDNQIHGAGPWDVFLGYRGGLYANAGNAHDNGTFLDNTVMVGARMMLHGPTDLLTNDRRGANVDLPRFNRWSGVGPIVD